MTGGGAATPEVVTTLSALQSAVSGDAPAVIWVKGKLDKGDIRIGSNKTIAGICGASIGGHLEINGSSNVIIRNIAIVGYAEGDCALDPSYDAGEGCSSGVDAITVQNSAEYLWFDHCDISDGTDGNLDITKGSDFVTVSWTKFHYTPRTDNQGADSTGASGHRYSNLVGGSDSESSEGKLNITWHHNWWADNVVERQPRVRFGKNHVYNNYYSSTQTNYAVRAGHNAHLLIENNYFTEGDPHEFNSSDDQSTAHITAVENAYSGASASGTKDTGGDGTPFSDPPYDYTVDAADQVPDIVQNGAGPQ